MVRLAVSLITHTLNIFPNVAKKYRWEIHLWDINEDGLELAKSINPESIPVRIIDRT